jgi:hypothetical protein
MCGEREREREINFDRFRDMFQLLILGFEMTSAFKKQKALIL